MPMAGALQSGVRRETGRPTTTLFYVVTGRRMQEAESRMQEAESRKQKAASGPAEY